jgi:LPXTG-site transpeptidase (sortase) family protein
VIPVFNPPPLPAVRQLPPQRLVVPRLGIDAKVVELGTKRDRNGELVWETAAFAAGHHRGTANPGEAGNMVISGHISSPHEGDVFRRLPEIAVGDGAIVYTAERVFLYRVVEKHVVPPSEVSVMEPGDRPTLTLITCVPDGVYSHRLVVFAHEV